MLLWKCPVCGMVLEQRENVFRCVQGHSFDIARQGYVNLLMRNQSADKRHGDDKAMVRARREFLEKGYYDLLREKLCGLALRYGAGTGGVNLLDAGCGEGWYTEGVLTAFLREGRAVCAAGVDISREALIQASKRGAGLRLAVGSVRALPVPDASCDLLLSVFAPHDDGEFYRVLRPGGVLLRAVPLERHLYGLKQAVYDAPYENPTPQYEPEGFVPLAWETVRTMLRLTSQPDIQSLFMMTPYYYKTGPRDQKKLAELTSLETEAEFGIFVMKKE